MCVWEWAEVETNPYLQRDKGKITFNLSSETMQARGEESEILKVFREENPQN